MEASCAPTSYLGAHSPTGGFHAQAVALNCRFTFEKLGQTHFLSQNDSHDETNERLKLMKRLLKIPIAFPAIYQDKRMISQRSCFTIHGEDLNPIRGILNENDIDESECLIEYNIDVQERNAMMLQLNILGISAASLFPDLDHLAEDLRFDIEQGLNKLRKEEA